VFTFPEFQKIRKDVETSHRAAMGGSGVVAGGGAAALKPKKPKGFTDSSKYRKTKQFNEALQRGEIDQSTLGVADVADDESDGGDRADTPPSSPTVDESKEDRIARKQAELATKRPATPGKKLTKAQLKKLKNKEMNDAKQVAAGKEGGAKPLVLDFGEGEEEPEEDLANIDVGDVSAGGGRDIDDTEYHVPVKKGSGGVFSCVALSLQCR
jgi:hypothetical protein